jgi:UDP-N-acetylmuramoyl-L-alanyl-D-glutamate--2,6-diaminopimelate ligase
MGTPDFSSFCTVVGTGPLFYNCRMKLQELFAILPGLPDRPMPAVEVTGVFQDARKVILGGVFVAMKGQRYDGHDFLPQAIQQGAVALVISDIAKLPAGFTDYVLTVDDTRPFLDLLASRFFWDPSKEIFCAGVTGTNGKTSTTYLIEAILNHGGLPTGVIGTVNHHLGDRVWDSEMTTPDPLFLQRRLREFRDAGAAAVAMEVSSHALEQRRADSVAFNSVIFTNLSRDHLDYHKSMEAYFESKQRLFLDLLWKTSKHPCYAIVNLNDEWGRRLRVADPAKLWTFGTHQGDFRYKITHREFHRSVFHVEWPSGKIDVSLPMGGDHNVENAMGALICGVSAGLSMDKCAEALFHFSGVPGRLQRIPNEIGLSVFVDYAHTPDALENVLSALKKVREGTKTRTKIWTLFGCGGDRDKGKRPLMLFEALNGSDFVVVTSDNPRTEDPDAIIQDIIREATKEDETRLLILPDRRQAIEAVIQKAAPGDVILIAGKGHEEEQIIGDKKYTFSDAKVAAEALERRKR